MAAKKNHATPLKQLKIAVAAGIAVLFVLGVVLVAQGFIDTRNYSEQVINIIQEHTKRQVTLKGTATVSLLPVPTLFIPGLELRDPDSDLPAPAATVDMISIRVPLMSAFSQDLKISSIAFDRPVLELTRTEEKLINWDWINADLVKAFNSSGSAITLEVHNGKILYRDTRTDKTTTVENVTMSVNLGGQPYGVGAFRVAGHDLTFNMSSTAALDATSGNMPFKFALSSGNKDSLKLEGELNLSGELPAVKGSMVLDLEDAPSWLKPMVPEEEALFKQVTNQFTKKSSEKILLPLKISSDWNQQGMNVEMNGFIMEGLNSAGAGKVHLTWEDWQAKLAIDMKFSAINFDQWNQMLTAAFLRNESEVSKIYREINETPENPLPEALDLTLNLVAEQLYLGPQIWKDAVLSAHMGEGSITVNQFNVALPGESSLTLFGIISPSTANLLRFEGTMETEGKSLRQMLTVFDDTAADLPETGFGEFFAHANMFVSSEQLRMSEADVKLGDLHLNGGLVAYFDSSPRVEADVKLKNIDFDYFRDIWRQRQEASGQQHDFFLKFDKSMSFGWLKKLQTAIDFKVAVENFTFLDRKGDNASFRLYAKTGDLGIYDINFIFPTDITKGNFKLNVNGEQPSLNLKLATAELNTNYFHVEPTPKPTEPVNESPVESPAESPADGSAIPESPTDVKESPATPSESPAASPESPATSPESPVTSPESPAASPESKPAESPVAEAAKPESVTEVKKPEAAESTPPESPVAASPALPASPESPAESPKAASPEPVKKLEIEPQAQIFQIAANEELEPPRPASGLEDIVRKKGSRDITNIGENTKRWSEELIDMSWLNGFSGELDLSVGKMTHKELMLGNLKLKAKFGKDLVTFKTFSFSYWGGQCSILGSLYGGKVPGFSVSFTIVDARFQEALKALSKRENVNGQISVSATISTSGVNLLSWVSQAEGKVVVIGRNIYVQGLNMQGVVDAVAVSRTASDVLNSVNRAFTNGATLFSVDGHLNVKGGMIRTPGIGLRTENIIGNLMGELKMVPWTLDMTTMFQFPSMSSDTIPTMTIQYSGTPLSGDIRTDTSSLESFVAKRIISK